jgi:hypothetical protein
MSSTLQFPVDLKYILSIDSLMHATRYSTGANVPSETELHVLNNVTAKYDALNNVS